MYAVTRTSARMWRGYTSSLYFNSTVVRNCTVLSPVLLSNMIYPANCGKLIATQLSIYYSAFEKHLHVYCIIWTHHKFGTLLYRELFSMYIRVQLCFMLLVQSIHTVLVNNSVSCSLCNLYISYSWTTLLLAHCAIYTYRTREQLCFLLLVQSIHIVLVNNSVACSLCNLYISYSWTTMFLAPCAIYTYRTREQLCCLLLVHL